MSGSHHATIFSPIHNADTSAPTNYDILNPKPSKGSKYTLEEIRRIRNVYLIGIMVWIFIAWIICIPSTCIEVIILLVPVVLFFLDYINLPDIEQETEDAVFADNYLSISLLVVIPFFTNTMGSKPREPRILSIVIFAIGLLLLSILDIWVPRSYLGMVKHIKTMFQTSGLILVLFALYLLAQSFGGCTGP